MHYFINDKNPKLLSKCGCFFRITMGKRKSVRSGEKVKGRGERGVHRWNKDVRSPASRTRATLRMQAASRRIRTAAISSPLRLLSSQSQIFSGIVVFLADVVKLRQSIYFGQLLKNTMISNLETSSYKDRKLVADNLAFGFVRASVHTEKAMTVDLT